MEKKNELLRLLYFKIVRNSVTNARTSDLVPLAGVPGDIIPWHFKRHQLSSFFPKTIIQNGNPWQIPLFLLSVQRIHSLGLLHRHSTEILRTCACPVLLKVTGCFGPNPGRTRVVSVLFSFCQVVLAWVISV